MPTTSYYTVGGEILGERVAGGARRNYGVDALGSVTSTMVGDSVENYYSYKPYGEELSRCGEGSDLAPPIARFNERDIGRALASDVATGEGGVTVSAKDIE